MIERTGRATAALTMILGLALGGGARAQDSAPDIGRQIGEALGLSGLGGSSLDRGALLFHGNYCGPGNRAPAPPIDALDAACMHHDACSPDIGSGRVPACGCNRRLRYEATMVARDPRQPDDLRKTAQSVADGALLLPCR
jgi:hypothetical protein